jgi:hypothetical protein
MPAAGYRDRLRLTDMWGFAVVAMFLIGHESKVAFELPMLTPADGAIRIAPHFREVSSCRHWIRR